jgi:uncharacterized protein (UPF0261 family)
VTGEKSILVLATLDTKGIEAFYLRDKIAELGNKPVVLDISLRGKGETGADISPQEVAEAGGSSLKEIHESGDRVAITAAMTRGAIQIAKQLVEAGKIHGVIGIGGSTGSLMATDVMRALPFGIPKLMISSTAALPGMSTRYIDTGDILLMHSVIEISGLNDILRNVIDRAAYAISGMVEVAPIIRKSGNQEMRESGNEGMPDSLITDSLITDSAPLIAMTMLGPCEKCASSVRLGLEQRGFQVVGFSAAGIGDRAMEDMAAQGLFDGVVDLAPGGVMDHLIGGTRDAGPRRLESAGRRGIPQVISTCGVNHITPRKTDYTAEHKRRRKYDLDRYRTWLRASPQELARAAQVFAEKLNQARGPAKVVIPLEGWSSVDRRGNETYDPQEDLIFVNELKSKLKPDIEVRTVAANMEDPSFSQAILEACEAVM